MLTKVLLGLLCISLVQAIGIRTPELETIYSGTGGSPEKGWDNKGDSILYPSVISVAEFLFFGSSDQDLYYAPSNVEVMSAPKVTVESGSDIVSPIIYGEAVDGYHFEATNYYEEYPHLNIFFNCQTPGKALISVSVDVSTLDPTEESAKPVTETVKFYFSKECRNSDGYRTGFYIGKDFNNEVVNHGVVQHKWRVDSYYDLYADPTVIEVEEEISPFTISISSETYGNQYFFAPELYVEDDDLLSVTVRGNSAQGGVATIQPDSLFLIYDCHAAGTTDVTVSISLGFYGTIRFGFTKSCTSVGAPDQGKDNKAPVNSNPGLINVGTSRSEYASVVDQSVTSLYWDVITSSVVVEHEEIFTNFYISTKSGQTQEVLKPVVTVNPPVFGVALSGPFRDGGIATGAPQHMTVNYLCNRISEAQVIITLKLPGFKTVEFSYLKKCKVLKRHKGHIWTANQVMILFVVVIVVAGLCVFSYYRKKTPNTAQKQTKTGRPE